MLGLQRLFVFEDYSFTVADRQQSGHACDPMLGLLPGGVLGRMRTEETAALWQLYEQTNGVNWTKNENWDLANDPCRLFRVRRPHVGDRYDVASEVMSGDEWYEPTPWYGVSCSDPCDDYLDGDACYHGRATALRLRQNGLSGNLNWTRMGEMANLHPNHNLIALTQSSLSQP